MNAALNPALDEGGKAKQYKSQDRL